jgi:glycosyltransferase involved in cell wall biosynthesis
MTPRVLVVSNFIPPVAYGGYEIGCAQVVEGLREAGMDVRVLTSSHRMGECPVDDHVHRVLDCSFGQPIHQVPHFQRARRLLEFESNNLKRFRDEVQEFCPDVVYFWNLAYVSRSLLSEAARLHLKHGCFLFDCSLTDPSADLWDCHAGDISGKLPKRLVRLVVRMVARVVSSHPGNKLRPDFCHYPTDFIRRHYEELGFRHGEWIKTPWGVDETVFAPAGNLPGTKILYVGQVAEHKGVHVAVEALGRIVEDGRFPDLSLSIAGKCLDAAYRKRLDELIGKWRLSGRVAFLDSVERDMLPALYNSHALLVFPSIWEEPMGIVILEAMSCGLSVVSSGTGGSRDLTSPEVDGLFFHNGDAEDCARQIERILAQKELRMSISSSARQTILSKYRWTSAVLTITRDIRQRSQSSQMRMKSPKCCHA